MSFVAQLKCLCPLNFDELSTFLLIGYATEISFSENYLFHHALKQIILGWKYIKVIWFNLNYPDLILLQVSI